MARKKSSKCSEPINTMLDVTGVVTFGLYAKHKKRILKKEKVKHPPKQAVWFLDMALCVVAVEE